MCSSTLSISVSKSSTAPRDYKKTKQRKSRILFHYTREELEPYFHVSQKEAAKMLGIAVITLKRICKRGQFNWPYRASKAKKYQPYSYIHKQTTTHPTIAPNETEMFDALQALAMCAMTLEAEPLSMSPAAIAYSKLPHLCMQENK